jgi:hypothetical protein
MLLNKFMVIYALFLACSLGVGLLAAGYGLMVLARRRADDTAEKQHHLEKFLYLCSSAMFIGALIRIVMLPLWFYMLHSLIPSIPGAMCLAGVHLNVGGYAWAASSMKLILPLIYFTWIYITRIDRSMPTQPFFRLRQILLAPMILLLFCEAFLDINFLTGLTPSPVTCCTAIFDFNTQNIPPVLTETHWYFVIIFLTGLLTQIILLLPRHPGRWVHLGVVILSVILFVSLPIALHTRLSPLILDSPFHHCIFCVVENSLWVLTGFALSMVAIYLSFAHGLAAFTNPDVLQTYPYSRYIRPIVYVLYLAGVVLIAIPAATQIFSSSGGF